MRRLFALTVLAAALAACSTTPAGGPAVSQEEDGMPEYRTGSIIAVKKTTSKPADGVKQGNAEDLEHLRNQSSIGTR